MGHQVRAAVARPMLALVVVLLVSASPASANHYRGGSITYRTYRGVVEVTFTMFYKQVHGAAVSARGLHSCLSQ